MVITAEAYLVLLTQVGHGIAGTDVIGMERDWDSIALGDVL